MVTVERVRSDYEPPLETHYAWVEVALDPAAHFEGTLADRTAGRFLSNNNAVDIANAIVQARAWAATSGATTIYVTEP